MRGASTIAMGELETYCQGFKRALEPWPPLPQAEAADLVWWQELLATSASGCLQGPTLLEALQAALPQLRLPQVSGISSSELYKRAVLRGQTPSAAELTAAHHAQRGWLARAGATGQDHRQAHNTGGRVMPRASRVCSVR